MHGNNWKNSCKHRRLGVESIVEHNQHQGPVKAMEWRSLTDWKIMKKKKKKESPWSAI